MVTEITTSKEIFTEFESIQNNIAWYRVYNTTVKVQLCSLHKKKYYISGKPREYSFSTLNLLHIFTNLLSNCKLQKV